MKFTMNYESSEFVPKSTWNPSQKSKNVWKIDFLEFWLWFGEFDVK